MSLETYTLDQIHEFQRTNRIVLQGTSPDVYVQNLHMRDLILGDGRLTGSAVGDFIGVQIIGSRANGTAALDSDLDFAAIQYTDGPYYENADYKYADTEIAVTSVIRPSGITKLDSQYASRACRIASFIPMDARHFSNWIRRSSGTAGIFTLFNPGIYAGSELKLCTLAAATMVAEMPSRGRALARTAIILQ